MRWASAAAPPPRGRERHSKARERGRRERDLATFFLPYADSQYGESRTNGRRLSSKGSPGGRSDVSSVHVASPVRRWEASDARRGEADERSHGWGEVKAEGSLKRHVEIRGRAEGREKRNEAAN